VASASTRTMFGGVVVGGRRCLLGGPSLRRQNMLRVRVNPWGQGERQTSWGEH